MTQASTIEARLASIERRLGVAEDRLAIYDLIARYGPAVDSRRAAATGALWTDDGTYDFGATPLSGSADIGALVDREPHVSYVESGCAHVMSLPVVVVDGDHARATGYSRVYVHDEGRWIVLRASANHWSFVRSDKGWRVQSRVNRLLDGNRAGRDILSLADDEE
ncbi:nuclear transport factor 2 family protein [uncultured Alsobacter sp.]|uniref:nuclear transport factor 2 family protein n=1 Tax=uncultured Alsobacter sp. TaxID=1748258 RepID=UPI0025EF9ABA|nr:nuclear transport factor 2 family protein [uncultured Alsobacter sp.]